MENFKQKANEIVDSAHKSLSNIFDSIDEITEYNQAKVLQAFYENKIGEEHFYTVTGYGHGVGMSLAGAEKMSENGLNYREILLYYFRGCKIVSQSENNQ